MFRVKAITRRKDAIYHAILAGGAEDLNLVGVPIQTEIYKKVSAFVPRIKDIATPGYVFGCVIAIEKQNEDQPKNALLAALGGYSWTKVVVVVDEDVDPFNAADVLWAISDAMHTRYRRLRHSANAELYARRRARRSSRQDRHRRHRARRLEEIIRAPAFSGRE